MALNVTASTQLKTFSIFSSVLKKSAILNRYIKQYHEYEPNLKSIATSDLPYIVIELPTMAEADETLTGFVLKDFEVIITLVVDYVARDKFQTMASAVIDTIESNESTFEASGYFMQDISFEGSSIDLIDSKQAVSGQFTVSLQGGVSR